MKKPALAGVILLLGTCVSQAQVAAGDLVGDFKQWCLSGPLNFDSFDAAMTKQHFAVKFDQTSPVYDEFQLRSKIWTVKSAKGSYEVTATTGTRDKKLIPMSCAVGIPGTADKVLATMQSDPRFGKPGPGNNSDQARSWTWNGPVPKSQIRLIESDRDTSATTVMIQFEQLLQ